MKVRELLLAAAVTVAIPNASWGQDTNVPLPVEEIERILRQGEFEILSMTPSRGLPSERTYQASVRTAGGAMLQMKYAPAAPGAHEFNNTPRYELGAYEVQRLFLDADEYVVPPTVARCLPVPEVQAALNKAPGDYKPQAEATFDGWNMTLVVLQFWLWNVNDPEPDDLEDDDLMEANPTYERHLANFNLFTYLIRHSDSNKGNYLRSLDPENPRVFSVDNGVAFGSRESDRGTEWRDLELDRYPVKAIERLRAYTLEDLYERLGVLVQFELQGGSFVETEPGENLDPDDGVRRTDTVIQLGLTAGEIRSLHRRLTELLERVDDGRYELF